MVTDTSKCNSCGKPISDCSMFKIVFVQGVRPADWVDVYVCDQCVKNLHQEKPDTTIEAPPNISVTEGYLPTGNKSIVMPTILNVLKYTIGLPLIMLISIFLILGCIIFNDVDNLFLDLKDIWKPWEQRL